MLNDASNVQIRKVYIATGYTDGRMGIDRLVAEIRYQFGKNPYEKGTLFLFCGRKCDRIRGLIWEGDGFVYMVKRLSDGRFQWPRNQQELRSIDWEAFQRLLHGFSIVSTIHSKAS